MYIVNKQQMKQIDQTAISEWKIPEILLMENAGMAVVKALLEIIDDMVIQNVTILVGSSNNGGDGLVVARQLSQLGVAVKVFIVSEQSLSESAALNLSILERYPVKIYRVEDENSLHLLKATLNYTDIVIDGIFGIGLNRPVSSAIDHILTIVNKRRCIKVAIDIPTGLDADTGQIWGNCLQADYTIALGLPKQGQFLNQGPRVCGEIIVKDICIPQMIIENSRLWCQMIAENYLADHLPSRLPDSHKGTYGHLAVLGGARGMSGAVTLAAKGAFRCGVGKVTCYVPQGVYLPIAMTLPEAMVYPLEGETDYKWSQQGLESCIASLSPMQAVIVGPGLGREEDLPFGLETLIAQGNCPMVIDADGLYAVAKDLTMLSKAKYPVILTPHPGEMASLTGLTVQDIQADRLVTARSFAQKYQVWLVLKGENTIIAAPDGKCWINTMDSPALAVAGSGDVLAGMIGACLAQGMAPEVACCCAVNWHGRAGLWLEEHLSAISSTAGDMVEVIPQVIRGV